MAPPADLNGDGETVDWRIENFHSCEDKLTCRDFTALGTEWKMYFYPMGLKKNGQYVSFYLQLSDLTKMVDASFRLFVKPSSERYQTHERETTHMFHVDAKMWGYKEFLLRSLVLEEHVAEDDSLTVGVTLSLHVNPTGYYRSPYTYSGGAGIVSPYSTSYYSSSYASSYVPYDSKKATGMVGLVNQGATCYLNSLLQVLFYCRPFRRIVYNMSTFSPLPSPKSQSSPSSSSSSSDSASGKIAIPRALQRLFYQLQNDSRSPSTSELTKSFGWSDAESFQMHDIQEMNRVLCDVLEEKLNDTDQKGALSKLLSGQILHYIDCMNVDYKSTKEEEYWDLTVDVRGCKNLAASFAKYCEDEMLDGENQYHAEGFGKQDAKKGCRFLSFPPVLNLLLKRFTYDYNLDMNMKINDAFEFPEKIDLREFVHESILAKEQEKEEEENINENIKGKYEYVLFAVLVHRGDVHGGHYYAFIKPSIGSGWYRFDDERVTEVQDREAINENFGGYDVEKGYRVDKKANAYMLVYIKESEREVLLEDIDVPDSLKESLEAEAKVQEEMETNPQSEFESKSVDIQIVTFDALRKFSRMDLVNMDDEELQKSTKVVTVAGDTPNDTPSRRNVVTAVAKALDVEDMNTLLIRSMSMRENSTCRPDKVWKQDSLERPLKKSVSQSVMVEYIENPVVEYISQVILLIKFFCPPVDFDPDSAYFRLVGKVHINPLPGVPLHSLLATGELSSIDVDREECAVKENEDFTNFIFWEEVMHGRLDLLDSRLSAEELELGNGDIIVLQRATEDVIAALTDEELERIGRERPSTSSSVRMVVDVDKEEGEGGEVQVAASSSSSSSSDSSSNSSSVAENNSEPKKVKLSKDTNEEHTHENLPVLPSDSDITNAKDTEMNPSPSPSPSPSPPQAATEEESQESSLVSAIDNLNIESDTESVRDEDEDDDMRQDISFTLVKSWVKYHESLEEIDFLDLHAPNPKEDPPACTIKLHPDSSYDFVVQKLGKTLDISPEFLRLYEYGYRHPDYYPLQSKAWKTLDIALDTPKFLKLYFERLPRPLAYYESRLQIEIRHISLMAEESIRVRIYLDVDATVGDMLDAAVEELNSKLRLRSIVSEAAGAEESSPTNLQNSDEVSSASSASLLGSSSRTASVPFDLSRLRFGKASDYRLKEVFGNRDIPLSCIQFRLNYINRIRALELPDLSTFPGGATAVEVIHFSPDLNQRRFGNSFFVAVGKGETTKDVLNRLKKQLRVPNEAFAKWKLSAFASGNSPARYLANEFELDELQLDEKESTFLGLEHPERRSQSSRVAKSIQIKEDQV